MKASSAVATTNSIVARRLLVHRFEEDQFRLVRAMPDQGSRPGRGQCQKFIVANFAVLSAACRGSNHVGGRGDGGDKLAGSNRLRGNDHLRGNRSATHEFVIPDWRRGG